MTTSTSRSIDVPGARVAFDVYANPASRERPLMLIGQPMGASGFATLRGYFADRTVITCDPRGAERSQKEDRMTATGPDDHAEDLHQIIDEVAAGPVDMFASSGGAINALALVAKYPRDVHTLVAHEPPLATALPDAEHALATVRAVHDTYEQRGHGAGMAHFIQMAGHHGAMTADSAALPAPDPQMFGMSGADDGDRADPLLGPSMFAMTGYEPDWDALRATPTRIVMAAGETSQGTLANRAAHAVADRLGLELLSFPGGHGGFSDSEWEPSDPGAFAARLRQVLV